LLIFFAAGLINSAFGFGQALIAVPLLALCIPLRQATPLVVLISIATSGMVVLQDWRKIHLRTTGWLLLATLPGMVLGVLLLTHGPQRMVKAVLALLIVAFSAYSLVGQAPLELQRDSRGWLLGCGLVAGMLGGAFGMNGPPLVIYGSMRRWHAQHFRATLQAYFLPASIVGMAGYWFSGLWGPAVTRNCLLALPVVLPAVWLGRMVNRRLSGEAFLRYVYVGLGLIGVLLTIQAITGQP